MNYQEEERFKELYDGLSDEALIEMAQAGEEDYQEGVYALIMDEVKKRNLDKKLTGSEEEVSVDFRSPDGREWIEIYRYDDDMIRMRLESFFKELGACSINGDMNNGTAFTSWKYSFE